MCERLPLEYTSGRHGEVVQVALSDNVDAGAHRGRALCNNGVTASMTIYVSSSAPARSYP